MITELETDLHLKRYLHIIRNSPVFPAIYDNRNQVLSVPPIINGEYSKMSANTKNVLIEVTATDLTKAHIVLNNMCAMFSGYCEKPFTIEAMSVVSEDGTVIHENLPEMGHRQVSASLDYIRSLLDIKLSSDEICSLLTKMMLPASPNDDGKTISVQVPPTRSGLYFFSL